MKDLMHQRTQNMQNQNTRVQLICGTGEDYYSQKTDPFLRNPRMIY